ncbi:MAG: rod shape-determining protein MreC [Pseudomonadota bacterium]|nr:rod shape-determining protein MreC [Pseudomonadota bacterium]
MKYNRGSVLRFAAPVRNVAQRFAYIFLLFGALAIIVIGRADQQIFERVRVSVTDVVAPILDAVSRPVATISEIIEEARSLTKIREENGQLKLENAQLIQWQSAARALALENEKLRQLLGFIPDNVAKSVTARVIGDSGGTFVRNILINAGRRAGIAKGQAALVNFGLIGRVHEVGERSARVLLITDLNSRIPVVVESTRQRAVLAGDNSDRPRLLHLPDNVKIKKGERIVTSGHGGVFPPGLPVGIVAYTTDNAVVVQPFVHGEKVEFARLIDFGLTGVLTDLERRNKAAVGQ